MAATPPPGYTPPPANLPQRGDRATFSNRVDAWVTWFSTVILTQLAAIVANAYANAVDAAASALAAAGSKTGADTARDAAQAARDLAQGYRDTALTYRNQAEGFAAAAANSASAVTATSTTSLMLTNGTKVLDVGPNKQFVPDQPIVIANPSGRMFGTVTGYISPNLTANITTVEGTPGTYTSWTIAPSGAVGPTGGTAGGNLTSALNEKKGAAPVSSATPDIWNAGGNRVPITSTTGWTGLPNAPQPGAKRTAVAEVAFPITSSANLIVHGGSTTANVGDELDVVAETVSTFKVTVRRFNGSLSSSPRNTEVLKASQPWTAKVTGVHQIVLCAAAASGGVAVGGSGARVAASGASTGGIVLKSFYAVAGDTYLLNLGARGVAVIVTSASQATPGNDAFDSTFTGTGVSLTAGGGKKGNATVNASGTAVALGAVGGAATGGDINIPGGSSGTVTVQGAGGAGASGGAASPFKGGASGSGTVTANGTTQSVQASGGGGVGGASGSVIGTDLSTAASAGAGSFGASPNITTTAVGAVPGVGIDSEFSSVLAVTPLNLVDAGSAASSSGNTTATVGGSGSGAAIGSSVSRSSGAATFMGGSGGVAIVGNISGLSLTSGNITYGGASGGVASGSNATPSQTLTSGNGGSAFAIIQAP